MENNTKKNPMDVLKESIVKFVDSYNKLAPSAKVAFENQLKMQIQKEDERTKKLYMALLEATKNGLSVEKTIESMEKTDRQSKAGV